MLAQIYEGCNCKDGTWRVSPEKIIDTERDSVETELFCDVCGESVTGEKKIDGVTCMHALTDEEIEELSFGSQEPEEDYES
jgi:hypothetical protein